MLKQLGIAVTSGAAPGYVEDRACGMCHAQIYSDYQEVGMARSFMAPRPENDIEEFGKPFEHKPSGRIFQLDRIGEDLYFKRWQLDASGQPVNVFRIKVDWIMGSGHHSRVYLYRTPLGELYQLPLAWYSQTRSWGMAPGYDRPDHKGVKRKVRRECMFCHNAYPDVPAGSDAYGQLHLFPEKLPEGTGCQRCHGPGEQHVRRAFAGETDRAVLASLITNPGKLSPQRRDDICFECHMQPTVALPGIRRFGRPDYSFRPGQNLADYRLAIDVEEEGKPKPERFEINHHPYRLIQSKCYTQSDGAMSCLTCHNPHVKVKEPERAAHFRKACLSCHQQETCKLETARSAGTLPPEFSTVPADDCVTCHMPKRRTHDVIQVTMTDHAIRRQPVGAEWMKARVEESHTIAGLSFQDSDRAPKGDYGGVYLAISALRVASSPASLNYLEGVIAENPPEDAEPYIELANALVKQKRFEDALSILSKIPVEHSGYRHSRELKGVALMGLDKDQQAAEVFQAILAEHPQSPVALFNLGLNRWKAGEIAEAGELFQRAVAARPNQVNTWYYLGRTRFRLRDREGAIQAYSRALEIDPKYDRAYLELARTLRIEGKTAEARRYLEHGVKHARNKQELIEALKKFPKK
ncbi:MAG: tetratricopeptide repeat protein [Acidobacteriota bacterium]|nr:tetratricopeptide repeat protein [Acidobacteriota bacterium]